MMLSLLLASWSGVVGVGWGIATRTLRAGNPGRVYITGFLTISKNNSSKQERNESPQDTFIIVQPFSKSLLLASFRI